MLELTKKTIEAYEGDSYKEDFLKLLANVAMMLYLVSKEEKNYNEIVIQNLIANFEYSEEFARSVVLMAMDLVIGK